MEAHTAALNTAIDAINSTFCIGGVIPAASVTITHDGRRYQLPMSAGQAAKKLGPLFAAARDSGFGKGSGEASKTVHDHSVRVAKELSADEVSVDFDPACILEQTRQVLVPESPSIHAELHKLNIMSQGSFFKPHKDTPRGASTCFGTLVVCLPIPFSGGSLVLQHHDEYHRLEWSKRLTTGFFGLSNRDTCVPTDAGLQWVAFFGDVPHEVEEVTFGLRLTLTYVLHREPPTNPTADVLLLRANKVHTALAAALADPSFLPQGGTLGFYCRHLYEESALAQAEATLVSEAARAYASKLTLKNEDAVVAALLAAAGLRVQVLRLLQMDFLDEDMVLDEMPTARDVRGIARYRMVEDSLEPELSVTPDDVKLYAQDSISAVAGKHVLWLGHHDMEAKEWLEAYYGDYFGNEACITEFYTGAAIIAKVPKPSQRAAVAAAAKQPLAVEQVGRAAIGADAAGGGGAASRNRAASRKPGAGNEVQPAVGSSRASSSKRTRAAEPAEDDSAGDSCAAPAALRFVSPAPVAPPAPIRPQQNPRQGAKKLEAGRGLVREVPEGEQPERAKEGLRIVHIEGGKGYTAGNGSCVLELKPEAGVKEVKSFLRSMFGALPGHIMGPLMVLDSEGEERHAARKNDLVDGVSLKCSYNPSRHPLYDIFPEGYDISMFWPTTESDTS